MIVRFIRRLAGTRSFAVVGTVALAVGAVFFGVALCYARLTDPPPTLLLRDRYGRFLAEVGTFEGEVGYWPLASLPRRVVAATLAAEDRRFWDHPGIDVRAVGRAAIQNARAGRRVSGASTVAMQVARMQRPGPRGYPRKSIEATTALFLVGLEGREAVMGQYLRLAPYGNRIHGIGYAARRYLDKPVEDLSWAETAFLAALPQAPGRMNPFDDEGRAAAVKRGKWILAYLREQGELGPEEYALALEQIDRLVIPHRERRPISALHVVLRLERELRDPIRRAALASRPIVDTTIDLDWQERLTGLASAHVERWEGRGAGNSALIVVEPRSREVIAAVGSSGYFDRERSGSIDYTRVPRSPGSILKPFLYAQALDAGIIGPATILDDLRRGAGGIANSDERYLGPLLPRVALGNSRNVPAADLLARIGLESGCAFLRELELDDGTVPARRFGLGLAIGGMPVTLERLVRAYGVLADDGRMPGLVWYRGAADPGSSRSARRLLSDDTARQITLFLSDPLARLPTFPRMGATEYPFPVAVKTGTSSNFRDAWTVAYSKRYLVGVWVGHPENRPMDHLSGATSAATLARAALVDLERDRSDGLEDLSFPPPRDAHASRVCALTGKLATPACDRVFVEWFRPGQEPVDACASHVRLAVDARSGAPAGPKTPRRFVEVRSFVDLPPRYAAWVEAAGLPQLPEEARTARGGRRGIHPQGARRATIRVVSPENGVRLLRDPEAPRELVTLALEAVVDPPPKQIVWYVDGAPFEVVDYPRVARWPLESGEHTFEARLPHAEVRSTRVRVSVE